MSRLFNPKALNPNVRTAAMRLLTSAAIYTTGTAAGTFKAKQGPTRDTSSNENDIEEKMLRFLRCE